MHAHTLLWMNESDVWTDGHLHLCVCVCVCVCWAACSGGLLCRLAAIDNEDRSISVYGLKRQNWVLHTRVHEDGGIRLYNPLSVCFDSKVNKLWILDLCVLLQQQQQPATPTNHACAVHLLALLLCRRTERVSSSLAGPRFPQYCSLIPLPPTNSITAGTLFCLTLWHQCNVT